RDFVQRIKRAYQARAAELHAVGLIPKMQAISRHADWYVRVGICGEAETDIRDQEYERDLNATVDLSTIKKGIDNFAVLLDLPARPKRSFRKPSMKPQKLA